ncbi:Odorant receptor 2 [Frankliniella occidentalis]|uniref:Uncharacterized protein LOC127751727 n=1 Tax=Frankliniella occidentalis TaxID=133901 RepID=A0A9C6X9E4_FRAOC|nr:uncharacterized protein LOC127751727 [Frankliniella occidentalis]KAE8737635.1 Odorant receptor 2 [Frankliniella occidentalis]
MFMGLCAVFMTGTALQRLDSLETARAPISNLSSCYSSSACLAVIRQGRLSALLLELKSLVQAAEAGRGEKKWTDRTLRGVTMFATVTVPMAVLVFASLCADMLLADEPQLPLWPFVPHAGAWGVSCGRMFWGCWFLLAVCSVFYTVTALCLCAAAAAGLHDALALRLLVQGGATPEEVRDVVRIHMHLRSTVLDLTDYFAGNLVHILASSFCNSLFATVQVVGGDANATTLALLIPVVNVFLPLSHFSQKMSDASRSLARSAYHAATDGVELREARALLLVMLAAGRPPALRCRGLGRFNRASARNVFRQFYAAVNMLGPKH